MKHTIILCIDTHEQHIARVSLIRDGKIFEKVSESTVMKSQMVLPLIETLLCEQSLTLSDISEIRVHTGPGSYTGIRVGLSIANSLSTVLTIPINGKSTLAIASYEVLE